MCRIKTGSQITGLHDVQNLVTACILRSSRPFSIAGLTKEVMASCEGSNVSITNSEVDKMVKDTTMAFLRIKLISANAGRYYAYPVAARQIKRDSI